MKKIALLIVLIAVISCGNKIEKNSQTDTTSEDSTVIETEAEDPILLGEQKRKAMEKEPYSAWYIENYQYNPAPDVLAELKKHLENTSITIFMGTWCEDSQMQVPAFYKMLDELSYDNQKVTLIMVSEDKDTPEGLEVGKDIQYVPTFILYKTGKEMGRIVEFPVETLEKDLLKIAKGQDYTHSYAE